MNEENEDSGTAGDFNLSISDMMSALCAIFVLLCIGIILQLKQISEHYVRTKYTLYDDLNKEFYADLKNWNAEINSENLSIRFKDPDVLFVMNQAVLRNSYKQILDDFFPRLLKVVSDYKNLIEEIRIEGHSSEATERIKTGRITERQDYEEGMELSQARTRSVLSYCLNDTKYPKENEWIRSKIIAIGYSKSHPVKVNGKIDWNASRRVEFRIKLNSDSEIQKYLATEQ
ncbi:OmpA family protein [uncultured Treponema sp.]|uniref:OmpA/MotB family protein n=1 Tax=uncultured Treponema sp. TaxID=162155 RepID=UPI0025D4DF72|nr:OmpA family protein [uncultured Treponema sp.]